MSLPNPLLAPVIRIFKSVLRVLAQLSRVVVMTVRYGLHDQRNRQKSLDLWFKKLER